MGKVRGQVATASALVACKMGTQATLLQHHSGGLRRPLCRGAPRAAVAVAPAPHRPRQRPSGSASAAVPAAEDQQWQDSAVRLGQQGQAAAAESGVLQLASPPLPQPPRPDASPVATPQAAASAAAPPVPGKAVHPDDLTPLQLRDYLALGTNASAVLDLVAGLWPAWAANGCRLLAPAAGATGAAAAATAAATGQAGQPLLPGAAPRPWHAAVALQAVAYRAVMQPTLERLQHFPRHRVVLGLAEALHVTPPRPALALPAAGSGAGKAARRRKDLGGGPGPAGSAAAAPAAVLAAVAAGEAVAAETGAGAGAAPGTVAPGRQRPGGLDEAQLAGAAWAMAVLGGASNFMAETEALCDLLPSCSFQRLHQVSTAVRLCGCGCVLGRGGWGGGGEVGVGIRGTGCVFPPLHFPH